MCLSFPNTGADWTKVGSSKSGALRAGCLCGSLLPSGRSHFLPQLTNEVERYAFQYETKMNSSDSTVVLYLEKVRKTP